MVKNPLAKAGGAHSTLGWEDPREKEIVTHSGKSHGERSLGATESRTRLSN